MFFGKITGESKYGELNEDANFRSSWVSMMTLMRAETGEDWNILMYDTMDATGNWNYSFFWTSFYFLKAYITINVVIAVIFQKLEEKAAILNLSIEMKICIDSIDDFVHTWQKFDR